MALTEAILLVSSNGTLVSERKQEKGELYRSRTTWGFSCRFRGDGRSLLVRGRRKGWIQRLRWAGRDNRNYDLGRLGHNPLFALPNDLGARHNLARFEGNVLADPNGHLMSGLLGHNGLAFLRDDHRLEQRGHMQRGEWESRE